jgi:polyisoprenyl-phosphate glycosyltransferase
MLSTRSEAGRGASMTAARRAGTLSVIVPVLNEEANIPELVRRLKAALAGGLPFDVIFVDDGSTDRTSSLLRALHAEDSRIKSIHLTRTFGHQAAISAGLQAATGDAVVVMDGDLQDAPEVVPQFVTRWLDGDDVVYAIRRSREASWVKRVAYRAFYRVLARISAIDLPLDSGDFSLVDRRVVDVLNAMPERTRFVRGLRAWAGFRQSGVPCARASRFAGPTKHTYGTLLRLALDGFFGFSYKPLQLASALGFVLSGVGFLFALGLALMAIVRGAPLHGWTVLLVAVLFLGGVQLVCLGILGEYVGRVYDEVRARPSFVVASVVGDTRIPAPSSDGHARA